MRRVSSDGRADRCPPSRFLTHKRKVPKRVPKRFPLQMGAFRKMRATPRPRTLPRRNPEIPELQALHRWNARMSTMRAPVPKEAWLAVERGPYLLGFPQWAGDGQNRRHTSNAPARHAKKEKGPICRYLWDCFRYRRGARFGALSASFVNLPQSQRKNTADPRVWLARAESAQYPGLVRRYSV
jgi:hypothetical protein